MRWRRSAHEESDWFLLEQMDTVPGELMPLVEHHGRARERRLRRRLRVLMAVAIATGIAMLGWAARLATR